jgi:hypothetical protein
MTRFREDAPARLPAFVQCPGCSFDFITGEGTRSCAWYDCPYLPEEYKVFCPSCNYNLATGEGAAHCDDFVGCEWAVAGREHAKLARERFAPNR